MSEISVYSRQFFFIYFFWYIYKIFDSEYSTNIFKSLNIVGTVMRNPKMLKLIPDHFKTKKMCKHGVKKIHFVIRYAPDKYKIRHICDKTILRNCGTLDSVPDCYKNQQMCDKAVDNYYHALNFVCEWCMTHAMCDKAVYTHPSTIQFVSECYKTQEMCYKVVHRFFLYLNSNQYKTQEKCNIVVPLYPF